MPGAMEASGGHRSHLGSGASRPQNGPGAWAHKSLPRITYSHGNRPGAGEGQCWVLKWLGTHFIHGGEIISDFGYYSKFSDFLKTKIRSGLITYSYLLLTSLL